METTRAERIRLGIFIFFTLALVLGTVVFLVGKQLTERTTSFHTRFTESVDGLNPGAKVKLNGIEIGQVTRIVVDPQHLNDVVVWFDVATGTPIKTGMMANLVGGMSLTGLKTIELTGGNAKEANVEEDGFIPAGTSSLKQLTGQAETLALKSEIIMNNLITMTNEENLANFASMLRHLNQISARTDSLLMRNGGKLDSITPTALLMLGRASATFEELQKAKLGNKLTQSLTGMDAAVAHTDLALGKTLVDVQEAAKAFATLTKRSDQTVYRNQEDISIAIRHMREAMENLNDVSRQVRENPSLLIRGEDKQQRNR